MQMVAPYSTRGWQTTTYVRGIAGSGADKPIHLRPTRKHSLAPLVSSTRANMSMTAAPLVPARTYFQCADWTDQHTAPTPVRAADSARERQRPGRVIVAIASGQSHPALSLHASLSLVVIIERRIRCCAPPVSDGGQNGATHRTSRPCGLGGHQRRRRARSLRAGSA